MEIQFQPNSALQTRYYLSAKGTFSTFSYSQNIFLAPHSKGCKADDLLRYLFALHGKFKFLWSFNKFCTLDAFRTLELYYFKPK